MAMSVRERVREVGVLKTLGFTPGTVLGLILSEACAISVAGGILGYLLSTVLLRGVANSPFAGFVPTQAFFDPSVAVISVLVAALTGLLSSLLPALSAARAPIVEALRSTE
jgi:putative ABC transport system permease protein